MTRRRATGWVLVDYENVQPASLDDLRGLQYRVIVFMGANQVKVPITFAESMQRLGSRAEYVRSYGNGSNALDFHLAFRLGELVPRRPGDRYVVISRDTGFDPLLRHLASRGVHARRFATISDVLAGQAAAVAVAPSVTASGSPPVTE